MVLERVQLPCDEKITLPIAVKYKDEPANRDTYTANIATGSGADLPAILGSDTMQAKDAVIIMRKGKEMMFFPGPGGYTISWSPGTKLLPMEAAPSGHMVIPCDKFAEASSSSGDQLAFITDHTYDPRQHYSYTTRSEDDKDLENPHDIGYDPTTTTEEQMKEMCEDERAHRKGQ